MKMEEIKKIGDKCFLEILEKMLKTYRSKIEKNRTIMFRYLENDEKIFKQKEEENEYLISRIFKIKNLIRNIKRDTK